MKIIGFAGSTSSTSINKKLVNYTLSNISNGEHSTELVDLNDYKVPLFNVDVEERDGYPENAKRFIKKLGYADAIVVSMAEHNASYAAEVKNLLDWCSRIDVGFFQEKPMLLMSSSPGGYGGGNVMEAASKRFPKFKADIKATFKLPSFNENFSEGEGIKNDKLKAEHSDALTAFIESLN
jgi:NAD(P)H-dependent FMN reductase